MKTWKTVALIGFIAGLSALNYYGFKKLDPAGEEALPPQIGVENDIREIVAIMQTQTPSYEGSSAAGSYLSGRFAQRHHDWTTANRYMGYVIEKDQGDSALLKRAMVLAMGAGQYDQAISLAGEITNGDEPNDTLAQMFLIAGSFKKQDYENAKAHIGAMPQGGLSDFIIPLLKSWSDAAVGVYNTRDLRGNSIHLYHGILIAEYMDKTDALESMLVSAVNEGIVTPEDAERIADIYMHIGENDRALELYSRAYEMDPENSALMRKVEAAKNGEQSNLFIRVTSPEEGVAEAFYDMARLLAQEYSDESARVFARVALYLNNDLTRARFLLADIASRNDRSEDAVTMYQSVKPTDEAFLRARRRAADILHEQGGSREAIAELESLANEYKDIDALIQIGDIYRLDENFKEAIKAYNRAEKELGTIGSEHWHLYYVRGMSYEQNGQWDKAEKDLLAALSLQPDHPYVLNYLGYAWTDQGKNLEQSLEMIKRAVELRPGDGYITDSLGWVYYRMGRYAEAVPHLEMAVELMPYDPVINDHLGDAYWRVGRTLEAEFQWKRAMNNAQDESLIPAIEDKIINGMSEAAATSPTTAKPKDNNDGRDKAAMNHTP